MSDAEAPIQMREVACPRIRGLTSAARELHATLWGTENPSRSRRQRCLDEYPNIGLIWADGGYANSVDATLIDWVDRELGIRLEVAHAEDFIKIAMIRLMAARLAGQPARYRGIGATAI